MCHYNSHVFKVHHYFSHNEIEAITISHILDICHYVRLSCHCTHVQTYMYGSYLRVDQNTPPYPLLLLPDMQTPRVIPFLSSSPHEAPPCSSPPPCPPLPPSVAQDRAPGPAQHAKRIRCRRFVVADAVLGSVGRHDRAWSFAYAVVAFARDVYAVGSSSSIERLPAWSHLPSRIDAEARDADSPHWPEANPCIVV